MSCADWVCDVDIQEGVAVSVRGIPRLAGAGWVPEIAPVRLEYAGTRTDDVDVSEFTICDLEHGTELFPAHDVGLDEDGSRLGGRLLGVLFDKELGLGSESQICNDYIATIGK